ncbi:hypothetical protein [Paludisphaera rhizosphaerae]|uniref:hypothetical protein n=1 Tax=Paludisphaera rhizosphaerae TaxID=2711216 RepID=UPI0013EDD599|nr:hypothetical protein [Paludisphaera rhizosphaerae]
MQRRRFLQSAALFGVAATLGFSGCSSDVNTPETDEGRKADDKAVQDSAAANDKAGGEANRRLKSAR